MAGLMVLQCFGRHIINETNVGIEGITFYIVKR